MWTDGLGGHCLKKAFVLVSGLHGSGRRPGCTYEDIFKEGEARADEGQVTASLDKFPFKVANGGSCSLPFDPGDWMGGCSKPVSFMEGGGYQKVQEGFLYFLGTR